MKTLFTLVIILSSQSVFAGKAHSHREHGAHVHGSASLAVAFDDKVGKVEFKGAAEAVLGFEYIPKKEKDKRILSEATSAFENDIAKMLQFDPALSCRFVKEKLGQFAEDKSAKSNHSNWEAVYKVECAKSPNGSKLTVDFTRFKNLKDLDLTLLIGNVQKSAEYKGTVLKIDL